MPQGVFEALRREGIIRVRVEAVCLDSTSAETHLNGAGAPKKTGGSPPYARGAGPPRRLIWLPQLTDRLPSSPSRGETTTRRGG